MGAMEVPGSALYGASTQRAVLNFPISGWRFDRGFIRALGLVKGACAAANLELGRLSQERFDLITRAAGEVTEGALDEHFPLDVFQTGSGTSTNMNANEVIANRCSQLAGKAVGSRDPVHPNDHVNMGQSSNDVIPTTIHIAVAERLKVDLVPALTALAEALGAKAQEFWDVIKIGRTHLMDATPVRLGQEFSGYAKQMENGVSRAGMGHRRAARASTWRHRGRHRAQLPSRTFPASSCAISASRQASNFARPPITSRRSRPRTVSSTRAAC